MTGKKALLNLSQSFGLLFCTSFALMILSISCESVAETLHILPVSKRQSVDEFVQAQRPRLIQSDPSRSTKSIQSYSLWRSGVG